MSVCWIVWLKDDGGLDKQASPGHEKKQMDSGYILKAELSQFIDRFAIGVREKEKSRAIAVS